MGQTIWLYMKDGATKLELEAWERLKEFAMKEGILTLEAESQAALDREHQRLVDEGWELAHMGCGIFRRGLRYLRVGHKYPPIKSEPVRVKLRFLSDNLTEKAQHNGIAGSSLDPVVGVD
jgi:hypothetical protein